MEFYAFQIETPYCHADNTGKSCFQASSHSNQKRSFVSSSFCRYPVSVCTGLPSLKMMTVGTTEMP